MNNIISPCNLVCSIDENTGYCYGCGRTSREIGDWTILSDQKRLEIMEVLPERLNKVKRKPRRMTKRQKLARQKTGD